jgi:hypothetical protein
MHTCQRRDAVQYMKWTAVSDWYRKIHRYVQHMFINKEVISSSIVRKVVSEELDIPAESALLSCTEQDR